MGKVLKANDVKISEKIKLEAGTDKQPAKNIDKQAMHNSGDTALPANVIVVEQNDKHTVLQFTCGCGKKTYIKCQHNN